MKYKIYTFINAIRVSYKAKRIIIDIFKNLSAFYIKKLFIKYILVVCMKFYNKIIYIKYFFYSRLNKLMFSSLISRSYEMFKNHLINIPT
jgi:hypothetical protein